VGSQTLNNDKIVAMLAELNALKGHLKLDNKLRDVIKGKCKGKGKEKGSNKKTKTRRTLRTRPSRRRTKHGRRCPPRQARRWASTHIFGVSIIWHGACISRLNVAWAKSRRRNSRRQSQPILQTLPPVPLLLLQWSTRTSRLSLPPFAQPCRRRKKKNDGASQHAYRYIC
jgi:hypothetical protein